MFGIQKYPREETPTLFPVGVKQTDMGILFVLFNTVQA